MNAISIKLGEEWTETYNALIETGFSQQDATEKTDKSVLVSLKNKMTLLAIQEPVAFQGQNINFITD